jgi:thioredoxin 1
MELVTSQQLEEMKSNGDKLLIDFFAEWCGPCLMLMPRLESFESQFPDVKFVKIDIDKNREYVMELGVRSVPTIMVYDGSKIVDTSIGVKPDSHYKDILNKVQEYGK